MLLRRTALAALALLLVLSSFGCGSVGSEAGTTDSDGDAALSAAFAEYESAVSGGDSESANDAFFRMLDLLFEDDTRHATDGRNGVDLLLDAAGLAHEWGQPPADSAPMLGSSSTGTYSMGVRETDALATILALYPDDARCATVRQTFVAAGYDDDAIDEVVRFEVDQHAQRTASPE